MEQRYSSTLSLTSALDGVGGQRHAPAALPPGKTRYPMYRRLGGAQGRSGRVRKISPHHRDSIPGPSSPQRVTIPTELSRPLKSKRSCFFLVLVYVFIIDVINSWSQIGGFTLKLEVNVRNSDVREFYRSQVITKIETPLYLISHVYHQPLLRTVN